MRVDNINWQLNTITTTTGELKNKQGGFVKNWVSYLGALILLAATNVALAHNGSVTISSPINSQTIVVESLPINIIVEGTISHNSPGNINNQKACVIVDGSTTKCEPSYVGDLGSMSSRGFSITVPVGTEGSHTVQATMANPGGSHSGISTLITFYVVLASVPCDEKDPPAYANEYLNNLNLPRDYATYRGQIIKVIAFNHSNGGYGSCHYDYDAVREDVNALLAQLGFYY